jgi:exodeoxyribonuclease VII small subunit
MPTSDNEVTTLEKELKQLERIVSAMESADLPLEKALSQFEQGIACVKKCQDLLKRAEQRIEILTREQNDELG